MVTKLLNKLTHVCTNPLYERRMLIQGESLTCFAIS